MFWKGQFRQFCLFILPVKDWTLPQHCKSCSNMCHMLLKVVTLSTLGLIKTINKTANPTLKLYTWSWYSPRGGHWLHVVTTTAKSTPEGHEWRGWRNRRGEEVPFRDCMGGKGVEEDIVLGLFLVQSLCFSRPRIRVAEEACWVLCLHGCC